MRNVEMAGRLLLVCYGGGRGRGFFILFLVIPPTTLVGLLLVGQHRKPNSAPLVVIRWNGAWGIGRGFKTPTQGYWMSACLLYPKAVGV